MSGQIDERITATRHRWMAYGMAILSLALSVELIVRTMVLKQDFGQFWDIGMIWIATNTFVAIGMTRSGVAPFGEAKQSKTSWMVVLLLAVEIPAVLWLMGGVRSPAELLACAALAGASALAMLWGMRAIYSRWERRTLGSGR